MFYPEETKGSGKQTSYREHVLYRAPHPNWGISNLEIADVDGDGDLDFLLAHGDTMDDGFAYKPYHGVEWLDNQGDGRFEPRRVGDLYGAHRAEAADLDGDGDLDVVASSYLPQTAVREVGAQLQVDSMVWFEHRGPLWIPWSLEVNHTRHTGMTVVDANGDGRLDVVGAVNFTWDKKRPKSTPALELWFNRGPTQPADAP